MIGAVTPLSANGPDTVIELTVIEPELLLFVSVTFCVLLVPTVALPKFSEVGLVDSCRLGATAVPLSATAVGDAGALLARDKLPLTLPELAGANVTVIAAELPAGIVIGSGKLLVLKPAPVTLAAVMDKPALPLFETATDWFPLPPTATLSKVRLVGVTEICGDKD